MNCTAELHSSAAHSPAIDRNVCSFRKPALQTESTRTEASSPRRQCFAATDAISPSRQSCGADIRAAASPPRWEVKLPGSQTARKLQSPKSPRVTQPTEILPGLPAEHFLFRIRKSSPHSWQKGETEQALAKRDSSRQDAGDKVNQTSGCCISEEQKWDRKPACRLSAGTKILSQLRLSELTSERTLS